MKRYVLAWLPVSLVFIVVVGSAACQPRYGGKPLSKAYSTSQQYTFERTVDYALVAFAPVNDGELQQLIFEAKPTIAHVISLIACGANRQEMQKFTDPNNISLNYEPSAILMRHHRSSCLKPTYIYSWEMVSPRVLKFTVDYQSTARKETSRYTYTIIKQADNVHWFFKWD